MHGVVPPQWGYDSKYSGRSKVIRLRLFDYFGTKSFAQPSIISLSFHRRGKATFRENVSMSSSTYGTSDFGEVDLTGSGSE
jgi:hypothetical protein